MSGDIVVAIRLAMRSFEVSEEIHPVGSYLVDRICANVNRA